jgi:hypothetical protein
MKKIKTIRIIKADKVSNPISQSYIDNKINQKNNKKLQIN